MTEDEANAYVEHYSKNRCECGGTPLFVHPDERTIYHLASCTAVRDFQREHGHYPWEAVEKANSR